jgi:hypothetical protein
VVEDLRDVMCRLTVVLDELCVVVLDHKKRLRELEKHDYE